MKKVSIFALVLALLLLCGCKSKGTEGLEFTQRNGSYAVTGYRGSDVDVVIPDTYNDVPVTIIEEGSFADSEIQSVKVGKNVEIIEDGAFSGASLLKEVSLPASLRELGSDWLGWSHGAFAFCSNLEKVTFAKGSELEIIGICAFKDCGNLKTLEIPDGVTYIGDKAFSGCTALKSLTIPASVGYVGSQAFGGFTEKQKIIVEGSTEHWMKVADGLGDQMKAQLAESDESDEYWSYDMQSTLENAKNWNGNCDAEIIFKQKEEQMSSAEAEEPASEPGIGEDPEPDMSQPEVVTEDNEIQSVEEGSISSKPVYLVTKETGYYGNGDEYYIGICTYTDEGFVIRSEENNGSFLEYVCNEDGYVIERQTYDGNSNNMTDYWEYSRDDNNNILSCNLYSYDTNESWAYTYTYASNGTRSGCEVKYYDSSSQDAQVYQTEEYKYAYEFQENKLISYTRSTIGESSSSTWIYEYDKFTGLPLSCKIYCSDGETTEYQGEEKYSYDANNCLVLWERFGEDGTRAYWYEFEYTLFENAASNELPYSSEEIIDLVLRSSKSAIGTGR